MEVGVPQARTMSGDAGYRPRHSPSSHDEGEDQVQVSSGLGIHLSRYSN